MLALRNACVRSCALLVVALLAGSVAADQLVLKDGTTLEGSVIPQGTNFWIKLPDGTSRTVQGYEVVKRIPGSGSASNATSSGASGTVTATGGGSSSFEATRRKADASETTAGALALWQSFLAGNPSPAEAEKAHAEQTKWQGLADAHAEKVGTKWLVGEELKEFETKIKEKLEAYLSEVKENQTIQALKTLEEIRTLYPNSFEANFLCGYAVLLERKWNDAITLFEAAVKLHPDNRAANTDLAVALLLSKRDLERGLLLLAKVVEQRDSPESAHNMILACASVPPAMQNNPKLKPAFEDARLMAIKYATTEQGEFKNRQFRLLMLVPPGAATRPSTPGGGGAYTGLTSGSGFIVGEDGMILTNRHVVDGATSVTVYLDGKEKFTGQVIMIDKEQDLALVQVHAGRTLPTVGLATEPPNEGAACFVLGFPLIDRMGASIKVTQGIVSGTGRQGVGADIVVDAKVNPGNSGGPLLDKYGRVIGIVTLKTFASQIEDSYGLAIGTPHFAQFLVKNHVRILGSPAGATPLTAEEVVMKVKPATVCIVATHGAAVAPTNIPGGDTH